MSALLIASAAHAAAGEPVAPAIHSTTAAVERLLSTQCASCHRDGGPARKIEGQDAERDPLRVVPGLAASSALFRRAVDGHGLPVSSLGAAEIGALAAWIDGLAPPPAWQPAAAGAALAVRILASRLVVGAEFAVEVKASQACHLTLIGIDNRGEAVVLFPNELEPDNAIPGGLAVTVPGANAGYRLRLDRPGRETYVALCQRHRRRAAGIGLDWERQRFTVLGDWIEFLRTRAEREAAIARAEQGGRRKRREPAPIEPGAAAAEAWTATAIVVGR